MNDDFETSGFTVKPDIQGTGYSRGKLIAMVVALVLTTRLYVLGLVRSLLFGQV